MDDYDYEFLRERLRDVENEIDEWRSEEDFFEGDRNFQRMLEERDDLKEQLDEYYNQD